MRRGDGRSVVRKNRTTAGDGVVAVASTGGKRPSAKTQAALDELARAAARYLESLKPGTKVTVEKISVRRKAVSV